MSAGQDKIKSDLLSVSGWGRVERGEANLMVASHWAGTSVGWWLRQVWVRPM